jgi:NAD(P)-dependent dehydrogenase (short-subunit alcohol dehydrogenase family)
MKTHTLVIGGTKGIGRVLVNRLIEEGHAVSVISRNLPENDKRIEGALYHAADITSYEYMSKIVLDIIENDKINHLVFCQQYRGIEDNWLKQIETSLTATKNIIELLCKNINDIQDRTITILSSMAGHMIAEEQPLSYHVVKAGLNQMVRYFALVLGRKGIRVNSVSPITVQKEEAKEFYLRNEQLHELYKSTSPLGRMLSTSDIVDVITFLSSKKASFITGQNIIVDGGMSLYGHESLARKVASLDNIKLTRD